MGFLNRDFFSFKEEKINELVQVGGAEIFISSDYFI